MIRKLVGTKCTYVDGSPNHLSVVLPNGEEMTWFNYVPHRKIFGSKVIIIFAKELLEQFPESKHTVEVEFDRVIDNYPA